MVQVFNTRLSCLFALSVLLVACGGKAQAPIEGTREQIVTTEVTFEPDPALVGKSLIIPPSQEFKNWPQANANARNQIPHMALPEKVTPAWQKNVMPSLNRNEAIINAPVVADGRLFIMTANSRILALDAWNGDQLWEADLRPRKGEERGLNVSGGLGLANKHLFVTTSGGQVYALDEATGDILWRYEVGSSIRSAPAIADERVYVVSHDNRLHVLDAQSGQLLWNHNGIDEALAMLGGASPAVGAGVVAVPYSSGEIYVLKASDGRYLWHDALSNARGLDPFVNINDIIAAPVLADGALYVANTSGQMVALLLQNGNEIWRRDYSAIGTPVVAGNALYVLTNNNQMLGLDRKTGLVKWVMNLGLMSLDNDKKPVKWFGPVLAGGRLLAISTDGYAVSVSPKDGSKTALRKLAKGASVAPVVANKMLYFLTNEGRLLAYD